MRIINPFRYLKAIVQLSRQVDLLATLKWNFRFFPFAVAKKLPLYIGYNVDIQGAVEGSMVLNSSNIQRGMIKIGITPFPIMPCKKEYTLIRFHGGSQIVFNGGDVRIMKGCSIVLSYGGQLIFGEDVFINQRTLFYANSKIEIGNHFRAGWCVQIYDTPIHYMVDVNTGEIKNPCHPIQISDNVWIANHATITAGAKIPPFTTVASHALVNKDFSKETSMGGLLVGIPSQYKAIGRVRLLNENIEFCVKTAFADKKNFMFLSDLGISILPFSGILNELYRSH